MNSNARSRTIASMEHAVIKISGLAVRGRKGAAVSGASFHASAGEIVAVFGPPGAGKTALLLALAGRMPVDAGHMTLLKNARIVRVSEDDPTPRGVTVNQWITRASGAGRLTRRMGFVARALESLGLYHIRDLPVRDLSRCQRRSAALAAGLASSARLFLIDSVMDLLPAPLRIQAWELLRERCAKEESAAIVATWDSELAERADRVLLLDSGRQLAFAKPEDLLNSTCEETVIIEASDPSLVQATLRGIFDVRIQATPTGAEFTTADGSEAAARLFRHPPSGARAVYIKKPDLWDVLDRLRKEGAAGK